MHDRLTHRFSDLQHIKFPSFEVCIHIVSGLLTYVKSFDLIYHIIVMYMNYIDIIKQTMTERGMSQQAFADTLGVNQTTVSQWLLGKKKPGYDSILLLYEKFGIEPNELFNIE